MEKNLSARDQELVRNFRAECRTQYDYFTPHAPSAFDYSTELSERETYMQTGEIHLCNAIAYPQQSATRRQYVNWAARAYEVGSMTLHARACAMAYTWQDFDVCESCGMNVKACVCNKSGQGLIDLMVGLAVVAVIFAGMVALFGQYHAGDMMAYFPH